MRCPSTRAVVASLLGTLCSLGTTACSPKAYIINQTSDALAESGSGTAWSGDDDPEMVRDALPFALKTMESLREANPDHAGLHKALAAGFTTYAYGFVQQDADRQQDQSYAAAQQGWLRARKLYHRAHGYALRALDLAHPGFASRFAKEPLEAVKVLTREDVEAAYWCGASLAAEISLSKDRPERVAQLPSVGAIMDRVLALHESFNVGAVHGFMVNYEARGESMGGSMERARKHFERAVELSGGNKAGPYVTWAEAYCVAKQDMACFTQMLDKAMAVDVDRVPGFRLENTISQRRATWLRARAADLIDVPTTEE